MSADGAMLCGPDGAVSPDDLSIHDRAAIATFSGFLRGEVQICPVCMEPASACTKAEPCCGDCPGFHLQGGKAPLVKHEVDE